MAGQTEEDHQSNLAVAAPPLVVDRLEAPDKRAMKKIISYLLLTVFAIFVFLAALSATAFMTKELDSDYKLVSVWGGPGSEPGKFIYPAGLKIYEDEVYVVDSQ